MSGVAVISSRAGATTPALLVRAAGLIVALALLSGVAVLWAAGSIGDAARTIGRDAEPSVALALRMTATLADMNAAAIADSLTDDGAAAGTSRAFRTDSIQLSNDMVEAARNVTYGEAEAAPLRALEQALFLYNEALVESRYIGAGHPWISSRRVQWASEVNRAFAAPAAQAVADANAAVLEERWTAYHRNWIAGALAGFGGMAALLAALLAVQVWLFRRMRRVVNLPLAAATAICAIAAVWFASQTVAAHSLLRSAKLDAYDSLHVLFEAKATVNALRADMSLWLLDPTVRPEVEARIAQAEESLIGDIGRDPAKARYLVDALRSALAAEQAGNPERALGDVPKVRGLLGTELANITFGMPERTAATDAVVRLLVAEAAVTAIQGQSQGHPAAAVAHWLDDRGGGGAAVFAAEQAALNQTIAVNQSVFDRDTTAILARDRLIAPVTLAALVLVALLSGGGLWLRLREYR